MQRPVHLRRIAEAIGGILRHCPADRRDQCARDVGSERAEVRRLGCDVSECGGGWCVAHERSRPGEHLEQHHPNCVQVGRCGAGLTSNLLRRQVLRCSDELTATNAGVCELVEASRDAEVEQLDASVGCQHDVRRLHVPVHDARRMSLTKRRENRGRDPNRPRGVERTVACDDVGEGSALDELHDEVQVVVRLAQS